jgi:hypothetical protein
MSSTAGDKSTTLEDVATGVEEKPKPDGRVVGGWATNEQIYAFDRAALEEGLSRAQWIVKACDERARMILAAKSMVEGRTA